MDAFFELKWNQKDKLKIKYNKGDNIEIFNEKKYKEYELLRDQLKKKKKLETNNFLNKIEKLDHTIGDINYYFLFFNIDYANAGTIRADYVNDKLKYYVRNTNKNDETTKLENSYLLPNNTIKYKCLIQNMMSKSMYEKHQNLELCEREKILIQYYLQILYYTFDVLEENGNLFFGLMYYCNDKQIDLIYILLNFLNHF